MMVPLLIAGLIVASAIGWLYGEFAENRVVRVISSVTCFILTVGTATIVSGFLSSINAGVPMTEAVHEYVAAIRNELEAGNEEHVLRAMDGFEERVHVTYETGWFIEQMHEESRRMHFALRGQLDTTESHEKTRGTKP